MGLSRNKKIYIESLAFSLAYSIIGFLIIKEDPLLIKGEFDYPIILLTILTLYYGLTAGLVSVLFFGVIMYFVYTPMPIDSFLWFLLLTLIFGGFHILWGRKTERLKEENSYFSEKLEDLGKEIFILRASHEQLEKNYIFRPFNIRNSLRKLREMLTEKGDSAFADFMRFLGTITGVESASLYLKKNEKVVEVSRIGNGADLKKDDPLIKLLHEKESTVFVSVAEAKSGSDYQAVIPIFGDKKEEIKGYLLIKNISFMQMNKDNLLTISVLTAYFFSEFELRDKISGILDKFPHLDSTFCKELLRIINLQKRFEIESSIIKFSVEDKHLYDVITTFIEGKLRGVDLVTKYQEKDKYWFFVLLPLTGYANASEFLMRMLKNIGENFGKEYLEKIHYKVLPVTAKEAIELLNRVTES